MALTPIRPSLDLSHLTKSTSLSSIFFDIGTSHHAYGRIMKDMKEKNYDIPEIFISLYEKMKIDGSRINTAFEFDLGISDFRIWHVEQIQKISKEPFNTSSEDYKVYYAVSKPAFDAVVLPTPTTSLTPEQKTTFHCRQLAIDLLKNIFYHFQIYMNDDVSHLVKSYSFDFNPGARIGIYYRMLYKMQARYSLTRKELLRMMIKSYEIVCQETYKSVSVNDGLYFTCVDGSEHELFIWITVGTQSVKDMFPVPNRRELYQVMGFPL